MDGLRLTTHDAGRFAVVAAAGELDITSAPLLRETLLKAGPYTILDLADLLFIDSTGLSVLIGAWKRHRADGGVLRLVAPPSFVQRMLSWTGLDRRLPVFADMDAAVREPLEAGT